MKFFIHLAVGVLFAFLGFGAQAQKAGVVTGHNTNATGKLSTGQVSVIQIGADVFFNETIATDASGRVQTRLRDGSSFTVGSNSSLVIDKFVYNPDRTTGEITASLAKGVVRFVGGRLSKTAGQVTISTTTGTIGIRGGIAIIRVSPDENDAEFSFHFGDGLTIALNDGRKFKITKPGTSLRVTTGGSGKILSALVDVVSQRHSWILRGLKGRAQNRKTSKRRQAIIKKALQTGEFATALSNGTVRHKVFANRLGSKTHLRAKRQRKRLSRRRRKLTVMTGTYP